MNAIKRVLRRRRTKWVLLSLIVGFLFLNFAIELSRWSNDQALFYNQAMADYRQGDLQNAVILFGKSQSAYEDASRQQSDWLNQIIYPAPDRALAAQASFQLAKAYLQAGQIPKAVQALNQSLQLNPGNGYRALDLQTAERLHQAAMVVKYDLELLYKQQPSQMQVPGQGDGPPADGDPQSTGRDPSNSPGPQGTSGSGKNNGEDM